MQYDNFDETIKEIIMNRTYAKIKKCNRFIFPVKCINFYRKDTDELIYSQEMFDFEDD